MVVVGEAHEEIAPVLLGSGLAVLLEMIYYKYTNSVRPNSPLVGFAKRELDLTLVKTHSIYWRYSKVEDEYIRISFRYTVQK